MHPIYLKLKAMMRPSECIPLTAFRYCGKDLLGDRSSVLTLRRNPSFNMPFGTPMIDQPQRLKTSSFRDYLLFSI